MYGDVHAVYNRLYVHRGRPEGCHSRLSLSRLSGFVMYSLSQHSWANLRTKFVLLNPLVTNSSQINMTPSRGTSVYKKQWMIKLFIHRWYNKMISISKTKIDDVSCRGVGAFWGPSHPSIWSMEFLYVSKFRKTSNSSKQVIFVRDQMFVGYKTLILPKSI